MLNISNNDWVKVIKNHIEKTGSYSAMAGLLKTPNEKTIWQNETDQDLCRDWEKYSNKLNDQDWIEWTVNDIKMQMETFNKYTSYADVIFETSNRLDIKSVIKLHHDLDIEPDVEALDKIKSAFDLDSTIQRFL
jgi:hypothetical protein